MKKYTAGILLALLLTLVLSGCGSAKEPPDTTQMLSEAQSFLMMCMDDAQGQLDYCNTLRDEYLDYVVLQAGLPCDGKTFKSILTSWIDAEKEMGSFQGVKEEFSFVEQNGEVIAKTTAVFEQRDADLEFTFEPDGDVKALSIGAQYTTGEILTKAGQNTLIGMGVVFAVLIFIAIIIWLMGVVLGGTHKKSSNTKDTTASSKETGSSLTPYTDQDEDEAELIAVITAAVSAYRFSHGESSDGFTVRSIQRRSGNRWTRA